MAFLDELIKIEGDIDSKDARIVYNIKLFQQAAKKPDDASNPDNYTEYNDFSEHKGMIKYNSKTFLHPLSKAFIHLELQAYKTQTLRWLLFRTFLFVLTLSGLACWQSYLLQDVGVQNTLSLNNSIDSSNHTIGNYSLSKILNNSSENGGELTTFNPNHSVEMVDSTTSEPNEMGNSTTQNVDGMAGLTTGKLDEMVTSINPSKKITPLKNYSWVEILHNSSRSSTDIEFFYFLFSIVCINALYFVYIEVQQVRHDLKEYLKNGENYLEIAFIVMTLIYLCGMFFFGVAVIKHVAAWSVFLAWIEVLIVFSRIPDIGGFEVGGKQTIFATSIFAFTTFATSYLK